MNDVPVVTRSPFAAAQVTLVAATLFTALMAVGTRYGCHRVGLYFRLLGERPSAGYFDTPPLTPMVAGLSVALFGDNVVALRLVPAPPPPSGKRRCGLPAGRARRCGCTPTSCPATCWCPGAG